MSWSGDTGAQMKGAWRKRARGEVEKREETREHCAVRCQAQLHSLPRPASIFTPLQTANYDDVNKTAAVEDGRSGREEG